MSIRVIFASERARILKDAELDYEKVRESLERDGRREQKLRNRFIQIAFNHAATDSFGVARSMILGRRYTVELNGQPPSETYFGEAVREFIYNPSSRWPLSDYNETEIKEHPSYQAFLNFLDREGIATRWVNFELNRPNPNTWSKRMLSTIAFDFEFK
jgi:hypothetical protein